MKRNESPPHWPARLRIALPLACGLGLVGVAVVLLMQTANRESEATLPPPPAPEATAPPVVRAVPVPMETIPVGDPSSPAERPQPAGEGLKRWNIDPLPEGWNVEIARRLAALFEDVDYDPADPEEYVEAEKRLQELREYLATLGPDAIPTLAAILNAETFFINRRQLLMALGDLGPQSEAATFALADYFRGRMGNSQAVSELNYAIKAMGSLKNDTSLDLLREMIDDAAVPDYHRAGLVMALGEHPRREESKSLFVDVMTGASEFRMRNYAAQALGKMATPDLLPDLYDAYDRENYWVAKQTILGSIGKIGQPSSIPFLADVARLAKESGVRLSAAAALRRIGTAHAWAILEDLSQTEPDTGVRTRILRWLEGR